MILETCSFAHDCPPGFGRVFQVISHVGNLSLRAHFARQICAMLDSIFVTETGKEFVQCCSLFSRLMLASISCIIGICFLDRSACVDFMGKRSLPSRLTSVSNVLSMYLERPVLVVPVHRRKEKHFWTTAREIKIVQTKYDTLRFIVRTQLCATVANIVQWFHLLCSR